MEKSASERIGIRIYTSYEPPPPPPPPPPLYPSSPPPSGIPPLPPGGRKSRAVAGGVQKTLSKTSLLANFLPTGTLLTFEMVLPSIYSNKALGFRSGSNVLGFSSHVDGSYGGTD